MQTGKPIIVLVDDSAAMRAFFEQVAAEADLVFHAYESAEASMSFLATRKPGLLFLNVMMPNRDGYSFLKELRRHELHASTPTVMISSKDYAQDRTAAGAARGGEGQVVPGGQDGAKSDRGAEEDGEPRGGVIA